MRSHAPRAVDAASRQLARTGSELASVAWATCAQSRTAPAGSAPRHRLRGARCRPPWPGDPCALTRGPSPPQLRERGGAGGVGGGSASHNRQLPANRQPVRKKSSFHCFFLLLKKIFFLLPRSTEVLSPVSTIGSWRKKHRTHQRRHGAARAVEPAQPACRPRSCWSTCCRYALWAASR